VEIVSAPARLSSRHHRETGPGSIGVVFTYAGSTLTNAGTITAAASPTVSFAAAATG